MSLAGTNCVSGCVTKKEATAAPVKDCGPLPSGVGTCETFYPGKETQTGATCSNSTAPEASKPKLNTPPCPVCDCLAAGKSWGTVNGVVTCVNQGAPGSNPVKQPTSTSSSSNSNTNSGGTSNTTNNTTSNTTINSNGTATTTSTTTGTDTSGNPTTSTTSETKPIADYCKENPKVEACKAADKGEFSGSCASGFTCDGDAATCAIAQETHKRNCQLYKEDAHLDELGQQMISASDSSSSPNENREIFNLPTQLDESSPIAAQCFDDVVIPFNGHSFTLPISNWCPYLSAIGYILLAMSYIAAARIIGGAV